MKEFKPTRLMVKRHSLTGLRYFCKTTTEQVDSYKGSGLHWERHIKKHGTKHVINEWVSEPFTDPKDVEEFALLFSELHDVVKSVQWANKKPENGLDGGWPQDDETRRKQKETFNDPIWKATVGKDRTRKSLEGFTKTTSDPEWKATVGTQLAINASKRFKGVPKPKSQRKKMSETQLANGGNGPEKHTEESIAKMKARYQDEEWVSTVWEEANRKRSEKQQDPVWQATVGVESYRKMAETRDTPEWQTLHSVGCIKCRKVMLKSGFHWHYKNCKE